MNRKKGIMNLYGRNNMVMMLSDKIYGSLGSRTTYVTHNAKGKPPLVLHNTLQDSVVGIEMQGWTEQVSTTGAQLFDKTGIVLTGTIITYTPVNVGDGEFTLSTDYIANNRSDIFFLSGNVNSGASSANNGVDSENNRTVTSENGYVTVALRLNSDGVTSPLDYQIMLNSGSKAKPYEPYTGGKPSPNPDYPQEITSAGKYDEGTGKYQYEVKLTGKNLFNPAKLTGGEIVEYNGIQCYKYRDNLINFTYKDKFLENTQYCFNVICLVSEGNEEKSTNIKIWYTDGTTTIKTIFHNQLANIVSSANKTVDKITGNENWAVTRYINLSITTLGIGTEPVQYEPYKEQTVLLTTDRPLTKWDKLEKRNGQWGWVYKSMEITLDGSWEWSVYDLYEGFFVGYVFDTPRTMAEGFCESFICEKAQYTGKDATLWLGVNNYSVYAIRIPQYNEELPDSGLQDWKDWLSENPITILTYADEETFVPLSAPEQELMNALYTFRPTTVLSNDQDCVMKITYKASE